MGVIVHIDRSQFCMLLVILSVVILGNSHNAFAAVITGTSTILPNNDPSGAWIELRQISTTNTNGTLIGRVMTDTVTGSYSFSSVTPGDYRLFQVDLVGNLKQTNPPDERPYFLQIQANDQVTANFENELLSSYTISGKIWNDVNENGVQDDPNTEPPTPGVTVCISPKYECKQSSFAGTYYFADVTPGDYHVNVQSMLSTVTQNNIKVTIVSSSLTSINFGINTPTPPPQEVSVIGAHNTIGGLPTVHFQSTTTYQKNVGSLSSFDHCGADKPVQIKLVVDFLESGNKAEGMMTEIDVANEIWATTMNPFYPNHGVGKLTFYVDCPPDTQDFPEIIPSSLINLGNDEIQKGGHIYIDPSGVISDSCTGQSIGGATVHLFKEYPPFSNTFITPPVDNHIPEENPEQSDSDGRYGWVVVPGNYKVKVDKQGYETIESNIVTIPPAVTDLNLSITPNAGCMPTPPSGTNQIMLIGIIAGIIMAIVIIVAILIRKKRQA